MPVTLCYHPDEIFACEELVLPCIPCIYATPHFACRSQAPPRCLRVDLRPYLATFIKKSARSGSAEREIAKSYLRIGARTEEAPGPLEFHGCSSREMDKKAGAAFVINTAGGRGGGWGHLLRFSIASLPINNFRKTPVMQSFCAPTGWAKVYRERAGLLNFPRARARERHSGGERCAARPLRTTPFLRGQQPAEAVATS